MNNSRDIPMESNHKRLHALQKTKQQLLLSAGSTCYSILT